MTAVSSDNPYASPRQLGRSGVYYGWVNLALAAVAMLATLPGRTQGLGLVTEPLLADLQIDRGDFAQMNLWATLLGAAFCLPAGRLTDRFGIRLAVTAASIGLGLAVCGMSLTRSPIGFFVLLLLVRGLGQSALSTISISMVGKWFCRRLGIAMGLYSVLVTFLFAAAFGVVGPAVPKFGWSAVWLGVGGAILLLFAPLAAWLVRSRPAGRAGHADEFPGVSRQAAASLRIAETAGISEGYTLAESVRTLRFWVFALATSLYGLAAAGLGLFGEAILRERGFDRQSFVMLLMISTAVALVGQLGCGWAMRRWPQARLLAIAMFLYGATLLALPSIDSLAGLHAYAVVNGAAGGMVIVLFFAIWAAAFGRAHLGRIQGAAQMLTVLASAIGPLLFETSRAATGSYALAFYGLALPVLLLAAAAWLLKDTTSLRRL